MSSSSRPPSPQQDLWSSILNSVSSTRSIPSKNVIVLGEPESGKSTLVRALLQKQDQHSTGVDGDDADRTGGAGDAKDGWGRTDFALGYEWADVRDEADEDTIARLSVYTVPSSSPAHLSLLPHFLPPKSAMPHSLVMIVLDWTRPWSFVDQLQTWLAWVEKWVHGDGARELEVIREEGKERLQSHLQHYTEPTASGTSDPLAQAATTLNSTLLPLGQGTLTHNSSGIPIIVVCTKADLIDDEEDTVVGGGLGLLKGKGGEWEERTDGIMQALRTICLKYGAALFYSTPQPSVLAQLRLYTLHFLFTPLPPAPSLSTAPSDAAPLKNPFPFPHRPNVLDRDRILVPAGWDSWGKISVVREGFDAARWGEAWERDLDGDGGGAKEMFRVLVGGDQPDRSIPLPALITTEPEQAFLARYHETLAKDPDRDPRGPFRPQPQNGTEHTGGVVGPMSSSSFTLPSVVKVMTELDGEDVAARLARAAAGGVRRELPRTNTNPLLNPPIPPSLASSTATPPTGRASPAAALGATSPGGGTRGSAASTRVLQDFFQGLLTARGGTGGTAAAAAAAAAVGMGPTSAASTPGLGAGPGTSIGGANVSTNHNATPADAAESSTDAGDKSVGEAY